MCTTPEIATFMLKHTALPAVSAHNQRTSKEIDRLDDR